MHDEARKEQLIKAFVGSEFRALLQLVVIRADESGSVVLLPEDAQVRNGIGTVHGGAIASLIDAACALAGFAYMPSDSFPVTRGLTVEYLSPGRTSLIAHGHVDESTDRALRVAAEVRDDDNRAIARGIASLRILHTSPVL